MQLREIYATRRPAVSIEFFPPKTPQGEENLAARIGDIKKLKPAFCSVTYGAGGSNRDKTLWWVGRIKGEFGIEVMCHLTCVGQSREQVNDVLRELQRMGVENIIALRGDPPRGVQTWQAHENGYCYSSELVAAARAMGTFSIAVAGFPEVHHEAKSRESDLNYLKQKVDAGADAIITQFFLDVDDFYRYRDDAQRIGVKVPIVPGILPFRSVGDVRRFTEIYARTINGPAKVPEALERRLENVADDDAAAAQLGIDYATEQCGDLLRNGVPGIHFYCMNESKAVEAILRNLRLALPQASA